jgi:HlyD family secretion protein
MFRSFISVVLLATAAGGMSYAYYQQDKSYSELFDQAAREARRHVVAIRDATGNWRLPRREMDVLVDGVERIYARVHWLVEKDTHTYITATIERGRIATVVRATGTVRPIYTVDVSSQLSGRMAEVLVNFNDTVKTGQTLGYLDREIYAAKVNEAAAALKIAQAGVQVQKAVLERARAALTTARMARNMAEANQVGMKAKLDETERQLERKRALVRTDSISKAELSGAQARRDAEAAEAIAMAEQVKMKLEAIIIAEAEIRMAEANLENAEAIVEQKQAALDQAEVDLARTELRAPIDGIIIKRDVNPGQTVAVSLEAKTLFQIANDLNEMEVHGKIDEADIGQVKPGQKVTFTVDAHPNRVFSGQVLQVRMAPEVVQNVVTYTVVITAPNPERWLLPGMTASLRILIDEHAGLLKIPNQALRFRPEGEKFAAEASDKGSATVWVIGKNSQPAPVPVTVGLSDDSGTEVRSSELREGQPVIVGIATPGEEAGPFGIRLGF